MDQQYYLEYFQLEREHWWFVVRSQILMDRLTSLQQRGKELKILNIGVATGRTTELLSKFGTVTSLEYDAACCEFTRQKTGIPVIQGSILALPFENESFDLVCAFDVIEHVNEDAEAAVEMNRVCRPGGTIFITVPAFMSLWSHHDEVNFHYRRYVMKSLLKLFSSLPLQVSYKTYFNSLLFIPIWLFRRISSVIFPPGSRKGAGSDFTHVNKDSFLNKFMAGIFGMERKLLRYLRFPAGVSILLLLKKES